MSDPLDTLTWISYAGIGLYFETVGAAYPLTITVYAAPFSAELLRLGNVFFALGADTGFRCKLGTAQTGTMETVLGYTVGGMFVVSIKVWEKLGVCFSAKGDLLMFLNSQAPAAMPRHE